MKRLLVILLSIIPLLAWANEAQMDSLHCGDVVTIEATPDRGYRFVRWSDGVTDNPREIEITEAVELTAIYEKTCVSDEVPVLWLYGQLMMVNVDSLSRMGYMFSDQSVNWYRIVGGIDSPIDESRDEWLSTGYYYTVPPSASGGYYAAVDVSQTPSSSMMLCTETIYSRVIWIGQTGLSNDNYNDNDNHNHNHNVNDNHNVNKVIIDEQLYIIIGDRVYRGDGSLFR